jgi:hypothetical protein
MQEADRHSSKVQIDRTLAHAAFALAERYRDGEITRDQAIDDLRAGYPGLSEGSYQDAFSQALFASR